MDEQYITGSGWKYVVIVSAVHLNQFFNGLYNALSLASSKFSRTDASITEDFYYTEDDNTYMDTIGLTALAAGIATLFSLGNPTAAASGALLSCVVYEGIVVLQNGQNKVEFEDKLKAFQT